MLSFDLLRQEEEKRARNWSAGERWRVFQATIAWVDAQRSPPRNSRESCLLRQAQWQAVLAAQGDGARI